MLGNTASAVGATDGGDEGKGKAAGRGEEKDERVRFPGKGEGLSPSSSVFSPPLGRISASSRTSSTLGGCGDGHDGEEGMESSEKSGSGDASPVIAGG